MLNKTRSIVYPLCIMVIGILSLVFVASQVMSQSEIVQAPAANTGSRGKVAVANSSFDFGNVMEGTVVNHDFILKNIGSNTVTINNVIPDCGCTAAELPKKTLEPGEEVPLSTVFRTSGFRGKKVKRIRVYTDSVVQPTVDVVLKGEIRRDVEVDPPRLFFGVVERDNVNPQVATILVEKGSDVKIVDVSSPSTDIIVEEEDIDVGGQKGKKLKVSLRESIPFGVFRHRIAIKTTSEKNPIINVPVVGRVEGDLRMMPADVSFGLLEGPLATPVSQTVKLINKKDLAVKVLKVESNDKNVDVEVIPVEDGTATQLVVTLRDGTIGTVAAKVQITTDHPDKTQNQVVLPVYGIVTKKGA